MKTDDVEVPQMRVRTNLAAGAGEAACQNQIQKLTRQLEKQCARRVNTPKPPYTQYPGYTQLPGYSQYPGYAPYPETEMQPWQAGDV